ncbi:MAG: autotransporter assembly complex family protein [Paracoccaceae bacterium]
MRQGIWRRTGFLGAFLGGAMLAGTAGRALEGVEFQVQTTDKALEKDLRAASGVAGLKPSRDQKAQDLFAEARAEYARLLSALYAKGRYSAVIHVYVDGREAADIAPLDAPARIGRIRVTVDPGPVFTFSRAQIGPLAPRTEIPEGFAAGKPAESGVITGAATAAVDGWRARGFAKAKVTEQKLSADHRTDKLSAQIYMGPGPRLRFGPLVVKGYERMSLRRILKIAGYPEGEVFDPKELETVANRLRRTGVFKSVSLAEDEAVTRPDLLGITATLVEEKPRRISFGAELGTVDGGTVSVNWIHRNLLGGAERLTVSGEVTNIGATDSGMDYSLGVTIDRPATLTPDTTMSFGTKIAHLDEADYKADTVTLGIGFTHIFTDQLTGRIGLGYEYAKGEDDVGNFTYKAVALPIGATWDTRDSKVDAARGFYVDAEAKPFYGLGDTESGLRMTADGRAYRGFGDENRFVLAGRLQLGAIYGSSLLGTPRNYLFYSGGGGTVRGQPYQSLGVQVMRGGEEVDIGGRFFAGASVEARVKITRTIGVVGFADIGSIGLDDFGDEDWHAGAGLGLRYYTGFGPIRLDVAAPVGGDTGDGVQLYVGLGQAF